MINKESNMAIEYVKEGGVSKYKVLIFTPIWETWSTRICLSDPGKMLYLMDRSNVRCALFQATTILP